MENIEKYESNEEPSQEQLERLVKVFEGTEIVEDLKEEYRLEQLSKEKYEIKPFERYERYEDMSQTGRLMVGMDSSGDMFIGIIPCINKDFQSSVEFCTVGSGGGKSPNTRRALIELAKAIQQDNEENPIKR